MKKRRRATEIVEKYLRSHSNKLTKKLSNEECEDDNDDPFSQIDFDALLGAENQLNKMLDKALELARKRNLRDYIV